MRLIDADKLIDELYHKVFEEDSDMQRWDSGCWVRYRLIEKTILAQPTITNKQIESMIGKSLYNLTPCR